MHPDHHLVVEYISGAVIMSWTVEGEMEAMPRAEHEAQIEARHDEIQRRIAVVRAAKIKARRMGRICASPAELARALGDEEGAQAQTRVDKTPRYRFSPWGRAWKKGGV